MQTTMTFLFECTLQQITAIVLIENALIVVFALIVGNYLRKKFIDKPVTLNPLRVSKIEIVLTFSTFILNSFVTLLGWFLWRNGIITIHNTLNFRIIVDIVVLFFTMDFLMYGLHRLAHHELLFPLLHQTHHRFIRLRPMTLFVLNPLENLAFGALWLLIITLYSASAVAIAVYLTINVIFGVIGHLGVEPLPKKISENMLLGNLTTSTFHAQHHQFAEYNFGFYTTISDRIFGTLSPFYHSHFGKLKT